MPLRPPKHFARNLFLRYFGDAAINSLREELKVQRQKAELAREQREAAREQRDTARKQREDARRQRKEAQIQAREALKRVDGSTTPRHVNYLKSLSATLKELDTVRAEGTPLSEARLAVREVAQGIYPPMFSQVFPKRHCPPASVAFATVANNRFLPGLQVLLASLLDVYPELNSDVIVFHDGTITEFSQRRLQAMYPKIRFTVPDMSWFSTMELDSSNRKRIGILGYMSVMSLTLEGYERVIAIDSDTAIIDDISMLWTGRDIPLGSDEGPLPVEPDRIYACQDYGARRWSAVSQVTGHPVINSGIISVPARYMTPEHQDALKDLVKRNNEPVCPLLDRFADQKAWNRFICERDRDILPINFNCNIKYLDGLRGGSTAFVRMVHFAGYKPWFDALYTEADLIPEESGHAVRPTVWRNLCHDVLGRLRQRQYHQTLAAAPAYFTPKSPGRQIDGEPACFFIGNGPSLNQTDLGLLAGFETFAFNWFIHHEMFDELKPDHLVLGSHMLFGGWQTQDPKLPESYLGVLRSKAHKPVLWTSFYFREYFEMHGIDQEFDIRYVLFEKPQKDFIDVTGATNMDTDGFTHDGRTGVLSVATPIALKMGYRRIGLVGCDSNYNQTAERESNYFYDKSLHASLETTQKSLTATWTEHGPGFFAYLRVEQELQRLGGGFLDCTIDGALPLPKGKLEDL
ncbi:glycosyltransferase [Poseidonocella sedimentorum]|uniref:Lipopolysaccharide biosynthesis protein, LPS:glycosyltransferase n=1 Tax=Poseidonocella sedimentorum TaxID=871652 RepID=A0A1I6ED66_9RHOB|nr:glycosyltransferase [Poseidonocella sedimentorum]SFR15645.1 Lipopolysaccharide biosynthesis protein, LPS:glycosyltransferase [Poseidonocella sedimentorum]